MQELREANIMVFIDELHTLIGAGRRGPSMHQHLKTGLSGRFAVYWRHDAG